MRSNTTRVTGGSKLRTANRVPRTSGVLIWSLREQRHVTVAHSGEIDVNARGDPLKPRFAAGDRPVELQHRCGITAGRRGHPDRSEDRGGLRWRFLRVGGSAQQNVREQPQLHSAREALSAAGVNGSSMCLGYRLLSSSAAAWRVRQGILKRVSAASEPRARSEPTRRRARVRVGEFRLRQGYGGHRRSLSGGVPRGDAPRNDHAHSVDEPGDRETD